jgi:hypothetical protein
MRLSATSTSVTSKSVAGSSSSGGVALPAYLTNTDDLVYYIDMHNSTSYSGSGTAITDLSGASENYATTIEGTLDTDWYYLNSDDESSNPAWGRDDGNGNNDGYIRTTNTGSSNLKFGTSSFTVEMWVRPHSATNYFTVFQTGMMADNTTWQSSNSKPYIFMYFVGREASNNSGKVRAYIRHWPSGSESINLYSDYSWSGYSYNSDQWGDWNHIVLTRSGSTYKLYVNSNLRETETSTGTIDFDGDDYCANLMDDGRSSETQTDYGRFGAARIYKGTALSQSDISAHFAAEKSAYGW